MQNGALENFGSFWDSKNWVVLGLF